MIDVRECRTDEEFSAIYPFIRELNKDMSRELFEQLLAAMREENYHCITAWQGEDMVGVCGYWIAHRFYCKKALQPDNVIIREDKRNIGIGRAIMAWLEARAKELGCDSMMLDSYLDNEPSHRFYEREGFIKLGYHFHKNI